jgi:hypothetical protein
VDDGGINLAGVRRLLSIADVARRLPQLVEQSGKRTNRSDELARAVDDLLKLLGVEDAR